MEQDCERFGAFLDEVDAEVETMSPGGHDAALSRILATAGFTRDPASGVVQRRSQW